MTKHTTAGNVSPGCATCYQRGHSLTTSPPVQVLYGSVKALPTTWSGSTSAEPTYNPVAPATTIEQVAEQSTTATGAVRFRNELIHAAASVAATASAAVASATVAASVVNATTVAGNRRFRCPGIRDWSTGSTGAVAASASVAASTVAATAAATRSRAASRDRRHEDVGRSINPKGWVAALNDASGEYGSRTSEWRVDGHVRVLHCRRIRIQSRVDLRARSARSVTAIAARAS